MRILASLVFVVALCSAAAAQSNQISYQGTLTVAGAPANGSYDFVFGIFPSSTSTVELVRLTKLNVAVVNGQYTIALDFGSEPFDGSSRFLEVSVRPAGTGAYTLLSPRTEFLSAPYAIRSAQAAFANTAANAQLLGGFSESTFARTTDPRLTDARAPLAGSPNYIQNGSTFQPNSGFNISGNAIVGGSFGLGTPIPAAKFQLVDGGSQLLAGSASGCQGLGAIGFAGTLTCSNYAFGGDSVNTVLNRPTGGRMFFRENNVDQVVFAPGGNVGIGLGNGVNPTERLQIGGNFRALGTIDGSEFKLGGSRFIYKNVLGSAFVGEFAGLPDNDILYNSMAIGYRAFVTGDDSIVLGSIYGVNGCTAAIGCFDAKVGIGTTSPDFRLDVKGRIRLQQVDAGGASNTAGIWFKPTATPDRAFIGMKDDDNIGLYGNNGGGWGLWLNTQSGVVSVAALGAAGTTQLCRNASNEISNCSSSIRYKDNVRDFRGGLDLVRRLRPVSFNWKSDGAADLGLIAEEAAAAEPLLATRNEKGEIEGVKYDRVGVVLVNAVNEQQAQIETQRREIEAQRATIDRMRAEIEALRLLVCAQNAGAALCRPEKK